MKKFFVLFFTLIIAFQSYAVGTAKALTDYYTSHNNEAVTSFNGNEYHIYDKINECVIVINKANFNIKVVDFTSSEITIYEISPVPSNTIQGDLPEDFDLDYGMTEMFGDYWSIIRSSYSNIYLTVGANCYKISY